MSPQRSQPDDDFWASGAEPGTAARWDFRGPDGIERLSGPHLFLADVPADFRATLTRVQLDHIALEVFRATPHRSVRGPQQITEHPAPYLSFIHVGEGEVRVETAQQGFLLAPGDSAIIDGRSPQEYIVPDGVRLLRTVVGVEHIPSYLADRGSTVIGPLRRTLLITSFIAFCSSVLRSSEGGRRVEGERLVRVMADLHRSVLTEARELTGHGMGPAGVRFEMEQYIDTHLSDQDLDPSTIAAAVGVSVRQAHAVFNDESRTIARHITDRRVAAVATALRQDVAAPLPDLATRYGFSSTETMSRAFRARLGMTPTDYRQGGHRHLG